MKTNYKQSQAAPHAKPIFTVSRNDSTLYVLPAYLAGAVMIRLQHIADGDKVKKLCCKVKNDRLMAMEQDVPQGNVTLTAVDIISPEKCAEKGYRKDGYGYVRTLLVTPTAEHRAMFSITCTLGERDQELFGAESLPIRHRADITRGRTLSASNDRYHAEHHEDARLLARACGARRGGLRGLTADGLRTDTEGNLRVHLREKGGKERDALVLPDYADRVRKIFAKYSAKPSNSKYLLPLTALPKDMPLHYLRAQYAKDLYRYFAERGTATGNMYYCRAERKGQAYDKGILLAVSQQMGHSRCDVVVSHYLY